MPGDSNLKTFLFRAYSRLIITATAKPEAAVHLRKKQIGLPMYDVSPQYEHRMRDSKPYEGQQTVQGISNRTRIANREPITEMEKKKGP